jgi:hypothetical protein
MTKIRLVQVEGEKFAVQKRSYFIWQFTCNSGDGYIWSSTSAIYTHALMETEEQAIRCFDKLQERLQMKKRKLPKVLRVIKTATV